MGLKYSLFECDYYYVLDQKIQSLLSFTSGLSVHAYKYGLNKRMQIWLYITFYKLTNNVLGIKVYINISKICVNLISTIWYL